MKNFILLAILASILNSCLEPLDSSTYGNHSKLLVVDGSISNQPGPYTVKLTYSKENILDTVEYINDASVYIIDETSNEIGFTLTDDGTYSSPVDFQAQIGKSYKLKIITHNPDNNYESSFCTIKEPSCIENIGLKAGMAIDEINNKEEKAVVISIDASVCSNDETFLRWTIDEDWVFDLPTPLYYKMIGESEFDYNTDVIKSCYQHDRMQGITLYSFKNQASNQIIGNNIYAVPISSRRFSRRYRATIKQHSISEEEFDYWRKLKDSSEDTGDLFGKQPIGIESNITCTTNKDEKVLGYFQTSGITQQEIYVTTNKLKDLGLERYIRRDCIPDTISPSATRTLYEQYLFLETHSSMIFYRPLYDKMGMGVIGLLYTTPRCSSCDANQASAFPPENWIEKD
ncbi:DUF4249 domain-containing protein [Plebeiibacterium marinum]|uniref:DUF4249 domain-containing protein n=1 Tax=Plebeiibacterium marinum TaxID=2992111 RepID=A0AAE3MBV5_9BACT|nr:DUF4249 domain-containing protein [Plebeiobacterium marinum]MCW3804287.1 DUF4249 domain-containing protein [Plebeiobacterium marinum]